jgi:hypothetical protein
MPRLEWGVPHVCQYYGVMGKRAQWAKYLSNIKVSKSADWLKTGDTSRGIGQLQ